MDVLRKGISFVSVLLICNMLSSKAAPAEFKKHRGCGDKPAEVFFLLDSSSSIWSVDFKKQLKFVSEVIETFDIGPNKTRIGVASFSYRYYENIELDTFDEKERIQHAISNIPQYLGGTQTYDALDGVRSRGLRKEKVRPGIAKILVVLTDGESYSFEKTKASAEKLKEDGVVVFAVGIGSQTDKKELSAIASTPTENYLFQVGNYDLLKKVKEKLAVKACEVEVEKEEKEREEEEEEHKDAGPACGANNMADVMFLVDPAEVGAFRTTQVYEFIANVMQDFNMGEDNIKVGLESQNCGANNINLGEYKDSTELAKAFRSTKVSGMARMLKRLRTHAFIEDNGARNSARNMSVIFVDDRLYDKKTVLDEARRTKNQFVELFVVAIGDNVVEEELVTLSSGPVGRHIIRAKSYEALMEAKPEFMTKFCHGL